MGLPAKPAGGSARAVGGKGNPYQHQSTMPGWAHKVNSRQFSNLAESEESECLEEAFVSTKDSFRPGLARTNKQQTPDISSSSSSSSSSSGSSSSSTTTSSCLLYTSPSPRDRQKSRMPSSA